MSELYMGIQSKTVNYEFLEWLLPVIRKNVIIPDDATVILTGSHGEGLANPRSDIDVFIIVPEQDRIRGPRHHIYERGRRIEVFRRSLGDLNDLAAAINHLKPGPISRRPAEQALLHLCQQLANGRILLRTQVHDEVVKRFDKTKIAELIAEEMKGRALFDRWRSIFFSENNLTEQAARLAYSHVCYSARSWLAGHGESYLSGKFVDLQMRRSASNDLYGKFLELSQFSANRQYVTRCYDLSDNLLPNVFESCILKVKPTIPIGYKEIETATYITDGEDRLFIAPLLEPVALEELRSNGWYVELVDRTLKSQQSLAMIKNFMDIGLLSIEVVNRDEQSWSIAYANNIGEHLILNHEGYLPVEGARQIARAPIGANTFFSAISELIWLNLNYDNNLEDCEGAVAAGHWSVAQHAMRRQALTLAKMLFCGLGLNPLPPDDEVIDYLQRRLSGFADFRSEVVELAHVSVTSKESSVLARERARRAYDLLPDELRAEKLRGSHESIEAAQILWKTGATWVSEGHRRGIRSDQEPAWEFDLLEE